MKNSIEIYLCLQWHGKQWNEALTSALLCTLQLPGE